MYLPMVKFVIKTIKPEKIRAVFIGDYDLLDVCLLVYLWIFRECLLIK